MNRITTFLLAALSVAGIVPAFAAGQTPTGSASVNVDGVSCGTNPAAFAALSWNVGVTNTQSSTGGGGGGAGKAVFGDLVVQKAFDECTPRLFLLAATGQHVRKVVLTQTDRAGRVILVVQIDDAFVTSFQLRNSETSTDSLEQLNFSYATLTITEPGSGATSGAVPR